MAYQGAYAKIDRERYEKYNKKEETVPQESEAASKQGEVDAAKQNNMQESEVQNVSEQNDKSEAQTPGDTQEKTQEQNNADGNQQKQTEKNEDEPVVISPSALKKLQAESGIKNDDVSHDNDDDEDYYDDDDDDDYGYEENEDKAAAEAPVKQVNKVIADTPAKPVNKSVNKKPVQPSSRRVSKNNTKVKGNAVIKNFPKSIMNYVKNKFSVETCQADILAAYIYIAAGKPVDMEISDNVKTVVDSYCGEDITIRDLKEEILTKLDNLKEMIRKDDNFIKTKLGEIELAVVYSLYCHFDWLKDEPESAGDVKFLEQGINDLFRALGRDAEVKRLRDAVKNGTPIR